jgi:hypothetical protein
LAAKIAAQAALEVIVGDCAITLTVFLVFAVV